MAGTVSTAPAAISSAPGGGSPANRAAAVTLAVAVMGFFIVTFDAVVVNVALPTIRTDLGGGITGLQWVVDGYTLMFAALLLTSGALSDRVGARRAFTAGLVVFVLASLACGLAPNISALVIARFVQGSAAALMMPASMALIGQAFPNGAQRARAVAIWAMGGAIASSTGPVLGGLFTLASWRLIFLINVPVGVVALLLLRRVAHSSARPAAIDWVGQFTAVAAMGGLVYGAIEAGEAGFGARNVVVAFAVAAVAVVGFVVSQLRAAHPMVPPRLVTNRAVVVTTVIGFAFMVGYYGLPFVFSLYFQQQRGLSALAAGALFLPMMLIGAAVTPFAARIAERVGARAVVVSGLVVMVAGLVVLGLLPASTSLWVLSALMILVGLGGPLVMPPATALLLNNVQGPLAGTASGVFNTSRQVGGALAIAVFGGLLAHPVTFMNGVRTSLLIAAVVVAVAVLAAFRLPSTRAQKELS
jgi:DHA2 family methylenomycin A resistance protein-like MFS transporter